MKIVKMFFLMLVLIGSICLISCGGSSGDDSDPDPYASFENVNGSVSDEWINGVTEFGDVPFASYRAGIETTCVAFKTTNVASNLTTKSAKNNFDHIYIAFLGKTNGTYTGSNAWIEMRISGQNSNTCFTLTNHSVTIKKYTDGYIEGDYTGKDFNNNVVKGSFVFKNVGKDNWLW